MKVSLNLGGGAARGYAHIGVIRALVEHKIHFDMIIGVSIGALVGANYALDPDVDRLESSMIEFSTSGPLQNTVMKQFADLMSGHGAKSIIHKLSAKYMKGNLLRKILLTKGILSSEEFESMIAYCIPDLDFKSAKIPFTCIAVDMYSGKRVVFQTGSIKNAVIASGSLPMVCPPKVIGGVPYLDGGVLDKIGIETGHELGVKHIIAVDVSNETIEKSSVRNSLDVLMRTEEISSVHRNKNQLQKASVVIKPIAGNIHWADYTKYKELIQAGYDAAISQMDEIREELKINSPFKKLFSFFR